MHFIRNVLAAAVLTVSSSAAWACSCAMWSPDELVAAMSIVFDGELVSIETVPVPENCKRFGPRCSGAPAGVFRVDESYKGDIEGIVRVFYDHPSGGNCGVAIKMNEPVTVAAYGDLMHGYETNGCLQSAVNDPEYRAGVLKSLARYPQRPE